MWVCGVSTGMQAPIEARGLGFSVLKLQAVLYHKTRVLKAKHRSLPGTVSPPKTAELSFLPRGSSLRRRKASFCLLLCGSPRSVYLWSAGSIAVALREYHKAERVPGAQLLTSWWPENRKDTERDPGQIKLPPCTPVAYFLQPSTSKRPSFPRNAVGLWLHL